MTNSTLREFNNPINSLKSALSFIAGLPVVQQFEKDVETFRGSQGAIIGRLGGIRRRKRLELLNGFFHRGSLTHDPGGAKRFQRPTSSLSIPANRRMETCATA
jgi:hypothetical protein